MQCTFTAGVKSWVKTNLVIVAPNKCCRVMGYTRHWRQCTVTKMEIF